jgi:hypothetical protein
MAFVSIHLSFIETNRNSKTTILNIVKFPWIILYKKNIRHNNKTWAESQLATDTILKI